MAAADHGSVQVNLLPAADRAPQPWRNGGGITFEVAREAQPPDSQRFVWRASIAQVDRPGPFSAFEGYERLIGVIEGQGMVLQGIAATETALRPFQTVRFSGAASVHGLLPFGPVRDLNLIFDPRCCAAQLQFLCGERSWKAAGGPLLLINLAGGSAAWHCGSQGGELALYDAVCLRVPAGTAVGFSSVRGAVAQITAPGETALPV